MDLKDELALVWEENRSEIARRVAVCRETAQSLLDGTATEDACEEAQNEAHKLAGVLGMFGFPAEGKQAAQIEEAFAEGPAGKRMRVIVNHVLNLERRLGLVAPA